MTRVSDCCPIGQEMFVSCVMLSYRTMFVCYMCDCRPIGQESLVCYIYCCPTGQCLYATCVVVVL